MGDLDKKDCVILDTLQKNCRTSLTDIAKQVGLSIDSVKKRIKKMEENKIFHPRIQIRPRGLGFNNIIDIKIKLNNHSKQKVDKFIKYLLRFPIISVRKRAGFYLENLGCRNPLMKKLKKSIATRETYIVLNPQNKSRKGKINKEWKIIVNR